ncbi:acetyl-CoA carboxylase biotin carboxyl carrier protein subunit [Flagellimonas aquimarina]|jgi:biotin carboxyl carrier protein|uniref:Acetyl-CoA carboxylase biotin carboxyl carrier protein subunit n=1 Tax=Flagellimonas aquimarina TaxID=2201895 RepID=A0A316KXI4_9FLAO|nr:acetyl-CoA carboxylase biotin carboxyl carrier protein subunit [Allomuricauda koreensis]PWL38376.1 acetyl-CoA carboxylase biotin carboxyl carrier protein subunit [Allomuricauda koreensis]
MENSYVIKVNENFDFQLSDDDISALDILKTSNGKLHLLKNGISYHIQIVKTDFNNRFYAIKVNGNEHQISIDTPLEVLIKKMGFATNGSKNIDSIAAPMPGLILDILVKEGEEVKEDDQLLILEAMKMENIITSPRNGVIKKIAIKKGEAVEKKQLLIEFQ